MKIKYDKETDDIYVILSSDKIVESEEKLSRSQFHLGMHT